MDLSSLINLKTNSCSPAPPGIRANSLVEALFALTFLSLGALSLLMALGQSYSNIEIIRQKAQGVMAAKNALNTLRAHRDFGELYQTYKVYDDTQVNRRFYLLENGSIDWSRPSQVPPNAIGEGFFQFVVEETAYEADEWGTASAFRKEGKLYPGNFDLDGNGKITKGKIVWGRTVGTPLEKSGYYLSLPVRVTLRIYSSSSPNHGDFLVIKQTLINNNYENN